jgi:CRP-like cAMP-binding protein
VRLLNQDMKVQALKRAPLFEGLSRKELVLLARVTEEIKVPAGEVLCRRVGPGQEFFVILEGNTDGHQQRQARRQPLRWRFRRRDRPARGHRGTATVTAKTPLRLFVLTRQDFRRRRIASRDSGVSQRPPAATHYDFRRGYGRLRRHT